MEKNIIYYSGVYWPKNPYFEINFINYLIKKNKNWNVKLLLDKDDIRLTGIRDKRSLNNFDHSIYKNSKNVIILEKYNDLNELTKNIDLFIGSNQIVDRRKITLDKLFNFVSCKKIIIDMYGYDIIKKGCFSTSDYILIKGPILKDWLIKDKFPENNIYVTGSPYFDYYKKNNFKNFDLSKKDFIKKYNLDENKSTLCLTTTNLCSKRIGMNNENLDEIIKFYNKFHDKYNFIIISYPNDYLFYEIENAFKRSKLDKEEPDYIFIQKKLPKSVVINCEDNINSLRYSDKIFHLSVGALSSEILFYFNKISYTMNFVDKEYYLNKIGYSKHVRFPDDICNINLKNIYDLDKDHNIDIENQKKKISKFFKNDDCHKNVNNIINEILK